MFLLEVLPCMKYFCPDCNVSEYDLEIVPKKECPNCHKYMNAEQQED